MNLVVIDTETGGFDVNKHALLSVSLVKLDDNCNPMDTLDLFIEPEKGYSVDPEAASVNGYKPDVWKERGAISLFEAMKKMAIWLRPLSEPIAHNAPFDKRFIDHAESITHIKLQLSYRWRCTMAAAMIVNDALNLRMPNVKLETLAKACGFWKPDNQRGFHAAHDDALACAAGYKWLIEKIKHGQVKEVAL